VEIETFLTITIGKNGKIREVFCSKSMDVFLEKGLKLSKEEPRGSKRRKSYL